MHEMVPFSTFSCGHNVMFRRRASSTAIVVSELRFAFIPVILYICKFPDSRCRPLMSLPDNLDPLQRCQGGKYKLCTYGAGMAKSRWAGIPSYAKTTDLSGSIFSSPVPESHRKTDTVFLTLAAAKENI